MQPSFRQLAPAPPNNNPEPRDDEPRKRRKKARLACNHCRLKRIGVCMLSSSFVLFGPPYLHSLRGTCRWWMNLIANHALQCDGTRPECARCLKARVPCVYLSEDAEATPTMALKSEVESLQRRLQEHNDFLDNIRSAPEDDILNIIRQLRSAENASTVLSLHQSRVAAPRERPVHALARTAMPSTESGIEHELAMRHPTAYPMLLSPSSSSTASPMVTAGSSQTPSSDRTPSSSTDLYPYCDPRLEGLTIGYWTRIPIDDGLAAQALSHFLTTDHPVLGFFDADLFLQDLVNQSLVFCSSFLFHSVMSLACVR